MILINLLPEELRVRRGPKVKVPYKLIGVILFLVFLVISLFNLYLNLRVRALHRVLEARWQKMEPSYVEALRLEAELGTSVLAEVDFYDTFVDPPLESAHILNLMSDLIPKSLVLEEVRFERQGKELQLTLQGISESQERDSQLVQIQDYANGLKKQMEAFLKLSSATQPAPTGALKADVTTSSRRATDTQEVRTEFTTVLGTEGFKKESY